MGWEWLNKPDNPDTCTDKLCIFCIQESFRSILRISKSMSKYVYQIQGALEDAQGRFKGLRVLVCDLYNFDSVDVPGNILDKDTIKFLEFRLKITTETVNIQRLPHNIQNKIRAPLGRWLDQWVLENFYGDTSNTKGVNP